MKNLIGFSLVFIFFTPLLYSQTNTLSAGGDASSSSGSVSYSIGQIDYISASGSNASLNQGVQQPFELFIISGTGEEILLEVSVYPNPVSSLLSLKFTSSNYKDTHYKIISLEGKTLKEKDIESEQTYIDMMDFPASTYLLSISKDHKEIKTFKIIKN